MVRNLKQDQVDAERAWYELNFPPLDEKDVQSFFRATSTALRKGGGLFAPVETLVFEMVATDRGFTWLLGVNPNSATDILNQLRAHIPGVRAEPYERGFTNQLEYAVEVGMTNTQRTLSIPDGSALSRSMLASVQALKPGEIVVTQLIITPAKIDALPRAIGGGVKAEHPFSAVNIIKSLSTPLSEGIVDARASSQEVAERQAKFDEPNYEAIIRVATYSPNVARLGPLVGPVVVALRSAKSQTTTFHELGSAFKDVPALTEWASTPNKFPAQLNVSELSAVLAWPLGQPYVAGLPQGSSRHMFATESIPREGRIVGSSNVPGHERPIAIGRLESLRHLHIMGPTGVGKTTLMAHLARQDMIAGYGVIVMESKGDLFNAALKSVPESRLDDVYVIDVKERKQPVGFNVLDQGSPRVVIDQLADLFQSLYSDTRGVWVRELLFFGLQTLAEQEGMSFVDVAALISPRTPQEVSWANEVRKSAQDKEIREFWQRLSKMDTKEQERNAAPLHNRIWQLVSRPELRNIIGQSKSAFQMDDIIRQNKILLINLEDVPKEAASLAGTLIMNAVWTSAKRVKAETANYLYLDEFQNFIRLPVGAEEMLAQARSFNLSMTLAHQHLAQLSDDVKSAVIANAKSKVYFQTSTDDSTTVRKSLGSEAVSESDLQQLGAYEAIARIATPTGSSAPVSLMTHPPVAVAYNPSAKLLAASRTKYGKPVAEIEAETLERRKASVSVSVRPSIGTSSWDEDK